MKNNLITEISRIKDLLFEQQTPLGDDWELINPNHKSKYEDYFEIKTVNNKTYKRILPTWVNDFPCLTKWGKKIINAEKDYNWVRFINTNNNHTYWFKKDGSFQYIVENNSKENGKWKCDGEYLFITMDNGETYSSKDRVIDRWSWPLDPKADTWEGDPYQYKVIDGQWHTKSWKHRSPKRIDDWKSLKNNSVATKELDRRFPNKRISSSSTNTQSPTQNQSTTTSPGQNTNTGVVSPNPKNHEIEIEFGDDTDITLPNDTIPNETKPNRRPSILQSA